MKAAVLETINSKLVVSDVVVDSPSAYEVLIRTVATGICHSDLHFVQGNRSCPLPAVLGHESAGVVEAVGSSVTHVHPDDHVVVCLSAFCGSCVQCISGRPNLCTDPSLRRTPQGPPRLRRRGAALHQLYGVGGFAEQLLVHESNVVPIPANFPLREASLMGCSIVTGVGAVLNTARVRPGSTVAVFGAGGVGLAAIQGARIAAAARIIAVDLKNEKLELALALGATDILNPLRADPVAAIRQLAGGGVDYAFDAVGDKVVARQAFEALAPGGVATVIGLVPVGEEILIDSELLHYERKIQGCIMGSNRFRIDVPTYVGFVQQGILDLGSLASNYWQLSEIDQGLEQLASGVQIRGIVTFD